MKNIQHTLVAGTIVNIIGILVFSAGFTNQYITELSPGIFSQFGLVMIMVWGVGYSAVSRQAKPQKQIVGVFGLEKMVYGLTWIGWMYSHSSMLPTVFDRSALTGIFYALYGPIDIVFGILFLAYALKAGERQ